MIRQGEIDNSSLLLQPRFHSYYQPQPQVSLPASSRSFCYFGKPRDEEQFMRYNPPPSVTPNRSPRYSISSPLNSPIILPLLRLNEKDDSAFNSRQQLPSIFNHSNSVHQSSVYTGESPSSAGGEYYPLAHGLPLDQCIPRQYYWPSSFQPSNNISTTPMPAQYREYNYSTNQYPTSIDDSSMSGHSRQVSSDSNDSLIMNEGIGLGIYTDRPKSSTCNRSAINNRIFKGIKDIKRRTKTGCMTCRRRRIKVSIIYA